MPGNGSNQHKPLPPIDEIAPHIHTYWKMRLPDVEVVKRLRESHIDLNRYGIGLTSYRAIRKRLGLMSARQQQHTLETIHEDMAVLRVAYPKAGAREMVNLLFFQKGKRVPRDLVVSYFRIFEPQLILERKAGRLQRRRFWAAGVRDLLAVDQHDKFKRFGLALHAGIDPFSGVIYWIRIWWTNNNPKLITSYYLDTAQKNQAVPLVTQSDPGSENYGIANAHTYIRQHYDKTLVGTVQHRWMRHKKNVKPEITWSQLRRRFTPGFENLIQQGVTREIYDTNRQLDVLVFRWLFIPFLQSELDAYADRVNYTRKRSDRNKILPHGIPMDIQMSPRTFGCLDFKIGVSQDVIDHVRSLYAPPDDPVFLLVPPEFERYAKIIYESLGSPVVARDTIWAIYSDMLDQFERLDELADLADGIADYMRALEESERNQELGPPEGRELEGGYDPENPDADYYMGGLNNGRGIDADTLQELKQMDDNDEFELEAVFSDVEVGEDGEEIIEEW
ncbi:hypothetical protein CPC08DRAFT_742208 [Agrocybe pediades]|nr:hypothetical protein CPC08DRAFT_742208 [Agrocybe pediades]